MFEVPCSRGEQRQCALPHPQPQESGLIPYCWNCTYCDDRVCVRQLRVRLLGGVGVLKSPTKHMVGNEHIDAIRTVDHACATVSRVVESQVCLKHRVITNELGIDCNYILTFKELHVRRLSYIRRPDTIVSCVARLSVFNPFRTDAHKRKKSHQKRSNKHLTLTIGSMLILIKEVRRFHHLKSTRRMIKQII